MLQAKLPAFQGPVPALEQVITAIEKASGADLVTASARIKACLSCDRSAKTSDGYVWLAVICFEDGERNKIALAVPKVQDQAREHGLVFDRLPVVYWQGTYGQAEVARLMAEFVSALEYVRAQKAAEPRVVDAASL